MKKTTRLLAVLLALLLLAGCQNTGTPSDGAQPSSKLAAAYQDGHVLKLLSDRAKLDGEAVQIFDYTWHCDPGVSHDEVKNAPAEYYTGTKPETQAAAYIDRELFYFPQLPEEGFRLVNYDGEMEWAYAYTDGTHEDYLFGTLPNLGNALPTQMMHSEQEAAENQVLHITKPGTYVLEGSWNGQIRVELGDPDETFTDETAKVTLVLNGADITCTVAPGLVFYSVYECDNGWESRESGTPEVDTSDAGAVLVLADGSENSVTGTNVFRMLKTKYKDEASADPVPVQKKQRKTDGALYSYMTMNIEGGARNTGRLIVTGGFEGLDSELHLSLNGGILEIRSQDDGINVNEDDVSVVRFGGADVTILAAQGAEGDGVDSNGFIVLDGGTVRVSGIRVPDSALDSEQGIYYHGGSVLIDGTEQSWESGSVFRESGGPGGAMERPDGFGERPEGFPMQDFDLQTFKEQVAALPENASLEDVLGLLGMDPSGRQAFDGQTPPEMPNGGQMPGGQQMPGGMQPPMK